ncbi:hypothetical protein ACFWHQ_40655 [Streptomyces sp. NPDC060334]|uniref:hypothetical protein n=1 Tax=Streptomyces sp. NPDC060334 TaxID=3347099 RepID=UPI00365FB76C
MSDPMASSLIGEDTISWRDPTPQTADSKKETTLQDVCGQAKQPASCVDAQQPQSHVTNAYPPSTGWSAWQLSMAIDTLSVARRITLCALSPSVTLAHAPCPWEHKHRPEQCFPQQVPGASVPLSCCGTTPLLLIETRS